jgi:uncharacterized protein (DUF1778 family)
LLGKNPAEFKVQTACDKAQLVLHNPVFFNFDDADSLRLTVMLEATTQSNPDLDRLQAVKAP